MFTKLVTIEEFLRREFNTDAAQDDVTGIALFGSEDPDCLGWIRSRENGIFSGEAICEALERVLNQRLRLETHVKDGDTISEGMTLVSLRGKVSDCLAFERTLLNILSHLCGVATVTRKYVQAVAPHSTRILATRKTMPGLRELQLRAVRAGGGVVHRRSLSDGILIKDNHLIFVDELEAVKRAKANRSPLHRIEVEVDNLASLERLLQDPPDVIMLDNMRGETLKKAIALIDGRVEIEVSGGVSLEEIPSIAALGVDSISVGRITHSVNSLDLTMEVSRDPG